MKRLFCPIFDSCHLHKKNHTPRIFSKKQKKFIFDNKCFHPQLFASESKPFLMIFKTHCFGVCLRQLFLTKHHANNANSNNVLIGRQQQFLLTFNYEKFRNVAEIFNFFPFCMCVFICEKYGMCARVHVNITEFCHKIKVFNLCGTR